MRPCARRSRTTTAASGIWRAPDTATCWTPRPSTPWRCFASDCWSCSGVTPKPPRPCCGARTWRRRSTSATRSAWATCWATCSAGTRRHTCTGTSRRSIRARPTRATSWAWRCKRRASGVPRCRPTPSARTWTRRARTPTMRRESATAPWASRPRPRRRCAARWPRTRAALRRGPTWARCWTSAARATPPWRRFAPRCRWSPGLPCTRSTSGSCCAGTSAMPRPCGP